jgi:hypothetical protein
VLLGGKLVYGQSDFSVDCTIRDLTETGARVRLGASILIDDRVWLINLRAGLAFWSTVAWRSPPDLGLQFLEQIDLKEPISGPNHHLRRLWIDSGRG